MTHIHSFVQLGRLDMVRSYSRLQLLGYIAIPSVQLTDIWLIVIDRITVASANAGNHWTLHGRDARNIITA